MSENQQVNNLFINNFPLLTKVIPRLQALAINKAHKPMIDALEQTFKSIPKLYEQDGLGYDAKVLVHYFYGSSDWFVTEYDPENNMAFGYVILNADVQMSEFGYISINELLSTKVEIDLHWNVQTLKEVLLKKDKAYFESRFD